MPAGSIDRSEVGVHVQGKTARFGVYLPGIRPADGFDVAVRLIHDADQFVPEIPSTRLPLAAKAGHPLGLWTATVDLSVLAAAGSHLGQDGQYLYRYELLQANAIVTRTFLDPFATENGPGLLGSFRLGAA